MIVSAQTWQSTKVFFGTDGKLQYSIDAEGNRIPDFSYAGYKNSEAPIPSVPAVKTIGPVAGDNTNNIQNAINEVGQRTPDASGFRGALLLNAGIYRVSTPLKLNYSGVILRGVGDGSDSATNTIIYAIGDSLRQETVLIAGGGTGTPWQDSVAGTKTNITTDTVYVGARTFDVENSQNLSVGDNIIIYHPCTDAWLNAIDYGAGNGGPPWNVNELPIVYNRYIKAKTGNTITIDAPVFNTLIRARAQCYVYKTSRKNVYTKIGIENLRIDIRASGITTDLNGFEWDHAFHAVWMRQVEDSWIKNCTMLHFTQSGIIVSSATRVTVDSCKALDPVCIVTGERRYNLNVYTGAQLVLFKNCSTSHGRHDYVSNGTTWVSGCVFVDCVSDSTYNSSEGHRRWSQGLLFDNITYTHPIPTGGYVMGLYNRGDMGTSHGWASAHSVAWNVDAGGKKIIIQKPPTAQNYAIGCFGNITGTGPFVQPTGYIEGTSQLGLNPRSLFYAQLTERLSSSDVGHDRQRMKAQSFDLEQNFPNPFNPKTTIQYSIRHQMVVRLTILDVTGREICTLVDSIQSEGSHSVAWDASGVASGVYICRLSVQGESMTRKIIILK